MYCARLRILDQMLAGEKLNSDTDTYIDFFMGFQNSSLLVMVS